jgi:hypothetical protein
LFCRLFCPSHCHREAIVMEIQGRIRKIFNVEIFSDLRELILTVNQEAKALSK